MELLNRMHVSLQNSFCTLCCNQSVFLFLVLIQLSLLFFYLFLRCANALGESWRSKLVFHEWIACFEELCSLSCNGQSECVLTECKLLCLCWVRSNQCLQSAAWQPLLAVYCCVNTFKSNGVVWLDLLLFSELWVWGTHNAHGSILGWLCLLWQWCSNRYFHFVVLKREHFKFNNSDYNAELFQHVVEVNL